MIDAHIGKLRARDALSDEEERAIRDLVGEVRDVPADRTLVSAGEELSHSILLLEGLLCRYKDLRDGSRQISELHVAGDFVDLHGFTLKRLDHSVMALTQARIALVPHDRLKAITEEFPHLTRLYWFLTNLDAAIHREWVLSLGRRSALARVAHLFCELQVKLGIVGLADESGYALGLTQADLAECLGLTPVHVNRMLKALSNDGLISRTRRSVTVNDWKALAQAGDFESNYLHLPEHRLAMVQ